MAEIGDKSDDSSELRSRMLGKLRMGLIGTLGVAVVLAYLAVCFGGLGLVLRHTELPDITPTGTPLLCAAQVLFVPLVLGLPASILIAFLANRSGKLSDRRSEDLSYGLLGIVGGLTGGWLGFKVGLELDVLGEWLGAALGGLLGGFLFPSWSFENPKWLVGTLAAMALSATATGCTGIAVVMWLAAGLIYVAQLGADERPSEAGPQDEEAG